MARQTQHYIEITARPLHSHIYTKPDKVISPQVQAQSMIQHIQQLPAVLRNALGHCYFPPNMSDLVTEFNNQTLVIASDGSMAHNTATQAWILYGTQTNTQAYGHGPVPGGGQPLTSLRAEIGGYVGGMLALDVILSTTRVPAPQHHCSIVALIDNKALISRINNWQHQGLAGTLAPEYDLLQVAQGVMAKHKMSVTPKHVKSHQDNSIPYDELPWQAKLNCDCDQSAGSSRTCSQCLSTLHTHYELPTGHGASLEIEGVVITSHIASAIKEASYRHKFIRYVTQKAGWPNKTIFHTIDWGARSRAGLHSSPGRRLTIFKLEFDLFATMSRRHKIERATDHRCPQCQQFQETLSHVFQCPQATEICRISWAKALVTIQAKTTCPLVAKTLGSGLLQWSTSGQVRWQGQHPNITDTIGLSVFAAFQDQQAIGWDQAIRGRLSKHWGTANLLYCTKQLNQGDQQLQDSWTSTLVSGMWQYGIDQWIGRNEFIYGKTKEERLEKITKEVDAQICRMHRKDCNKVRHEDRHLFQMSCRKRLAQTLVRKQQWVQCVTIAYEVWSTIQAAQQLACCKIACPWNQKVGQRPGVRLQPTR